MIVSAGYATFFQRFKNTSFENSSLAGFGRFLCRRLVDQDKADLAYPSLLAGFAIRPVRQDRRVCQSFPSALIPG